MTMQYSYGRQRGSGAFFGVLIALILGAVALGVFVHHARSGIAGKLAGLITGRPLTIVSAPDVVEKVQQLNRLETVVYSLDTVVEGNESNPVLPDVLAGDKLLMIVHGQTIAGIDMSKLQADSVQITEGPQGRSIRLSLPPSQVFLTTIDVNKTRVYARDTGSVGEGRSEPGDAGAEECAGTVAAGRVERWNSGCGHEKCESDGDGDARRVGIRACRNSIDFAKEAGTSIDALASYDGRWQALIATAPATRQHLRESRRASCSRRTYVRKPALPAITGLRTLLAITIILFHFTPNGLTWSPAPVDYAVSAD